MNASEEEIRPAPGDVVLYVLPNGRDVRPALIVSTVSKRVVNAVVFLEGEADYGKWREPRGASAYYVALAVFAPLTSEEDKLMIPQTWHWPVHK